MLTRLSLLTVCALLASAAPPYEIARVDVPEASSLQAKAGEPVRDALARLATAMGFGGLEGAERLREAKVQDAFSARGWRAVHRLLAPLNLHAEPSDGMLRVRAGLPSQVVVERGLMLQIHQLAAGAKRQPRMPVFRPCNTLLTGEPRQGLAVKSLRLIEQRDGNGGAGPLEVAGGRLGVRREAYEPWVGLSALRLEATVERVTELAIMRMPSLAGWTKPVDLQHDGKRVATLKRVGWHKEYGLFDVVIQMPRGTPWKGSSAGMIPFRMSRVGASLRFIDQKGAMIPAIVYSTDLVGESGRQLMIRLRSDVAKKRGAPAKIGIELIIPVARAQTKIELGFGAR